MPEINGYNVDIKDLEKAHQEIGAAYEKLRVLVKEAYDKGNAIDVRRASAEGRIIGVFEGVAAGAARVSGSSQSASAGFGGPSMMESLKDLAKRNEVLMENLAATVRSYRAADQAAAQAMNRAGQI